MWKYLNQVFKLELCRLESEFATTVGHGCPVKQLWLEFLLWNHQSSNVKYLTLSFHQNCNSISNHINIIIFIFNMKAGMAYQAFQAYHIVSSVSSWKCLWLWFNCSDDMPICAPDTSKFNRFLHLALERTTKSPRGHRPKRDPAPNAKAWDLDFDNASC